jgi:nucleoside-diphosphate-sugar epimerase
MQKTALVCGGHGFIGHHMAQRLKSEGYWVRTVDINEYEYGQLDVDDYVIGDLRDPKVCLEVTLKDGEPFDEVYQYSYRMGGAGIVFEGSHDAEIMHDSALLDINIAEACRINKAGKVFSSGSACCYPAYNQKDPFNPNCTENSAYPADPDSDYGFTKLFGERIFQAYHRNYGLNIRLARFHNIFGECFDDCTEIFTERGFKFFKDITFQDKFATRNPDNGRVEYQDALAIQNFMHNGPMYKIKNSDVDMVITPDHSMYVSTMSTKTIKGKMKSIKTPFLLKKIKDVVLSRIFLRSDFNWEGRNDFSFFVLPEIKMKDGRRIHSGKGLIKKIAVDLWLEFLGWYISEGSCFETPTNYTVAITQFNKCPMDKLNIDRIMLCIKEMGFSCYYDGKSILVASKQLWNYCKQFGHSHDKFIPREFLNLNKKSMGILFNSLMLGDGDPNYKNKSSFRYSTVSYQLATDVQEMAFKLGYQAWIGREDRDGYSSPSGKHFDKIFIYRVHICKDTVHCVKRKDIEIVNYNGNVYDITVPNHLIFVRRNGKCIWSGNCGSWNNTREKAPAALSRKIAMAPDRGSIEIWGPGNQTRSFLYIDECLEATRRLMASDFIGPVNIGSEEMISINDLARMIMNIAGKKLGIKNIPGPLGVMGRNSDNRLIQEKLGWAPSRPLREGMEKTYAWINEQVQKGNEDKGKGA